MNVAASHFSKALKAGNAKSEGIQSVIAKLTGLKEEICGDKMRVDFNPDVGYVLIRIK